MGGWTFAFLELLLQRKTQQTGGLNAWPSSACNATLHSLIIVLFAK